ncbi:NAD-dependent protein deacetylase [Cryptosporangium aurantiacum]|uniref:NAD-dependent protein deacetylase n=1 Tax=Cryptosporangium aurantiacum TaxID=134849 RepID=A0A1M7N6R5_9ACTN|nr:NAD-dependent protein deacetylase [Cryptosporangium aurantiacum]SHM99197.1 NAD-dependent protein deacetylase, SIR2 family [Cryptosporangium aurantiacum]
MTLTLPDAALAELTALVRSGDLIVLSGAGISTESGIPDYRGPSGAFQRNHTPMTYQAFTRDPAARRRYWARSFLGWRMISAAAPNDGHRAVARLESCGLVRRVITQNVDGLHQAGGAQDVVELHGSLDRVICLDCGELSDRIELDDRLRAANPGFGGPVDEATVNPDGDVDLPEEQLDGFAVVDCIGCGGVLKPDVVFFGENVPKERVADCTATIERAGGLLVLGSSLTVYSGRRFVVQAAKAGIPVGIVNQGPTRGDDHASVRVDAPLGPTLTALAAAAAP